MKRRKSSHYHPFDSNEGANKDEMGMTSIAAEGTVLLRPPIPFFGAIKSTGFGLNRPALQI